MTFFKKKQKKNHIFDFLCEMHFKTITLGKLRYAANNNGSSHKSPEKTVYSRFIHFFDQIISKKNRNRDFSCNCYWQHSIASPRLSF